MLCADGAIPFHGALEPRIEVHARAIAEQLSRLPDVGEAVPDVAGAHGAVARLRRPPQLTPECSEQRSQAHSRSRSHVHGLTGKVTGREGPDVRIDDVVDVGEVSGLTPVTIDQRAA